MIDKTPPCRVCAKADEVISWPGDYRERTICPECCETSKHHDGERGHEFSYTRHDGHTCDYCGIPRIFTDWDEDND